MICTVMVVTASQRIEGQVGGKPRRHHDDHGLADGAADGQHESRDDAGQRGRQHDLADGLRFGGAERIGAIAQRLRHGIDDVVG